MTADKKKPAPKAVEKIFKRAAYAEDRNAFLRDRAVKLAELLHNSRLSVEPGNELRDVFGFKALPYIGTHQGKTRTLIRVALLHAGTIQPDARAALVRHVKDIFGPHTDIAVMRHGQKFRSAEATLYGYTEDHRTGQRTPLHTGVAHNCAFPAHPR